MLDFTRIDDTIFTLETNLRSISVDPRQKVIHILISSKGSLVVNVIGNSGVSYLDYQVQKELKTVVLVFQIWAFQAQYKCNSIWIGYSTSNTFYPKKTSLQNHFFSSRYSFLSLWYASSWGPICTLRSLKEGQYGIHEPGFSLLSLPSILSLFYLESNVLKPT